MNAYNQDPSDKRNKSYKYDNGNDPYKLLVTKYLNDVKDTIINLLQENKKMSEHDAYNFTEDIFSLGDKRQQDIKEEVEDCYSQGKTLKQCAEQLIDKYYKIAKVNKHHNTQTYQTNRELSGDGEVTEIDEKVKYENFKEVSISLFWNFVYRLNDLGLKFNFDISYIKNLHNSLNTKDYVLYMETKKINNLEIENEFKYSKVLSSILNYLLGNKNTTNETSFYVGFDSKTQLHFGFIINDKRYKIGYVPYNSSTFQKLIPYIEINKDIDLNKLSRKFVSNIQSLSAILLILNYYLEKYEDDVEIYSTIINNNFGIIIETIDNENITQEYIENIIKQYVKISHFSNWYVEKMKSNNKTIYYFILK